MRKINRKVAAGLAGGAVALAGAGAAYAYWSSTGTGSGSATAGTGTNDLTANSAAVTGIVPGGDYHLVLTVANGNTTTSEHFTSITPTITVTNPYDATAAPNGCKSTDFTITGLPSNVTVAKSGSIEYSDANSDAPVLHFADQSVSQDGCKGQTVSVSYAVS